VFFKIVQNILKAAWGFIPIVRSLGPTQPISARTGLKMDPATSLVFLKNCSLDTLKASWTENLSTCIATIWHELQDRSIPFRLGPAQITCPTISLVFKHMWSKLEFSPYRMCSILSMLVKFCLPSSYPLLT
jgi:hypothetical protein